MVQLLRILSLYKIASTDKGIVLPASHLIKETLLRHLLLRVNLPRHTLTVGSIITSVAVAYCVIIFISKQIIFNLQGATAINSKSG